MVSPDLFSQRLGALAPKLMGVTGLGFIAAVYVPEHWQERTLIAMSFVCLVAGAVGYLPGWKARREYEGE